LTVDFHQVNNRDPYVYRTHDYGKTWKLITAGIPKSPLSYAHCVREDPVRRGLLYLGTENALYVSFNDGESWQPLQTNLPHAPVYWMVVQEHFNDLVVGTYGRGFWILDDLTPLQQLTPPVLAASAHLFAPRPAYRFRTITAPMAQFADPTAGENPPYGAAINYYLKAVPEGEVKITILNEAGQTVRSLSGSKNLGINRVYWDLRNEQTQEARLRTSPLHAPEVRPGPEGWRAAPGLGRVSVLMPPGTYTVKLSVGGQESSQPLTVRKDPHSGGSEREIETQVKLLLDVQKNLDAAVEMINTIEVVRSQLQALAALLAGEAKAAEARTAAEALESKLIALEEHLHQLRVTGRGQDGIRWPTKLAGQIVYLANGIASSDFAPTTQQEEVHRVFQEQIRANRARLEELLGKDLVEFNALLRERGIQNILAPVPGS
jgi:hypothetical protein